MPINMQPNFPDHARMLQKVCTNTPLHTTPSEDHVVLELLDGLKPSHEMSGMAKRNASSHACPAPTSEVGTACRYSENSTKLASTAVSDLPVRHAQCIFCMQKGVLSRDVLGPMPVHSAKKNSPAKTSAQLRCP